MKIISNNQKIFFFLNSLKTQNNFQNKETYCVFQKYFIGRQFAFILDDIEYFHLKLLQITLFFGGRKILNANVQNIFSYFKILRILYYSEKFSLLP